MEQQQIEKKIIGRLEYVDIPEFSLFKVIAKVDTGAYNGTISASSIIEFEKDGNKFIKFILFDEKHPLYTGVYIETDKFFKKKITSSNGVAQERYAIPVKIRLKDITLNAVLSLSNRKKMRHSILLGRKIFKKYFLVDASKKFTD